MVGMIMIDPKRKNPWIMAEAFVLPPDCMLAELLTITWVIGSPPIIRKSRYRFLVPEAPDWWGNPLIGSNLSVASTHKVFKLATNAMVKAVTQISVLVITAKLGKVNWAKKELASSGTGTVTKCSGLMA